MGETGKFGVLRTTFRESGLNKFVAKRFWDLTLFLGAPGKVGGHSFGGDFLNFRRTLMGSWVLLVTGV